MFNPLLATFAAVAECRSFSKAAERLYISPTAVMKQMNALEDHLQLKLIERTPRGIRLTPCGESIYKDSLFLFDYSRQALEKARLLDRQSQKIFRIGTSLLNPAIRFMELWYKLYDEFQDCQLQLVPFADDHEGILSEIGQIGKKFDFLFGVCDSSFWLERCQFLQLGTFRKMIAVPRSHRLAGKKLLDIEDLFGETLMMVKEGDSPVNDHIRKDLSRYPAIHIEDTPPYFDISVFNRCAATGHPLLIVECWKDVHQGLVALPVRWNYTIPYGLLYSRSPSGEVLRFLHAVEKLKEKEG